LRLWELPEPSIKNSSEADANRDWFLNSQNVTFVKIDLDKRNLVKFRDPRIDQVRLLRQLEDFSLQQQKDGEARIHRANRLYTTGDYQQANVELEAVESMDLDSATRRMLDETKSMRPLLLARLKKSHEAQKALEELIAKDPNAYQLDYVKCLVPLWLGRKSDASEIFRVSLSQLENKGPESIEMLARTAVLFAADESSTEEEKVNWRNMSIDLVERLLEKIPDARGGLRLAPEFLILHDEPRFIRLSLDPKSIPLKPFWIANREVTSSEFKSFLNDMNYQGAKPLDRDESKFARRVDIRMTGEHPAQSVNWFEAVMYCNWLSEKEGRVPAYRAIGSANIKNIQNIEIEVDTWELDDEADGYRLPLEVEWDYAGRAGSSTLWSIGNDPTQLIPYAQLEPSISPAISGQKLPNAWGLHDMHGNVREWCWLDYQKQKVGEEGVLKGGGFSDKIDDAVTVLDDGMVNLPKAFNSTFRTRRMERSFRNDTLGFRLVLNGPKNFRSEEVKK
jgi:formylglycine-generating enzyme required for sulfatase activity